MGLVPLLIFLHKVNINTFLDLALDFFNLVLCSGMGTTPHSRLFKFRFQFQVHLDQFFTRAGLGGHCVSDQHSWDQQEG